MARLDTGHILETLQHGEMDQVGLVPWGSNYTFLVKICRGDEEIEAIYKPRKGERPLWDFPRGTLCHRERAAFLVSEALGWRLVPPTVLREGPHGYGSAQYFIEHDPDMHYFSIQGNHTNQLQHVALFDSLVNNADRKGGHVLLDETDRLWSIDHGICFHVEHKLRSVIWDFAGETISGDQRADLERLWRMMDGDLDPALQELSLLLSRRELASLRRRLGRLLDIGRYPIPGPGRHYPWPPV